MLDGILFSTILVRIQVLGLKVSLSTSRSDQAMQDLFSFDDPWFNQWKILLYDHACLSPKSLQPMHLSRLLGLDLSCLFMVERE